MDEITLLKTGAHELGVELSDAGLDAFRVYLSELLKWNLKVNLTSITRPREIVVKHFLDSLALCRILPADGFSAVDIGSGAGFPGLAVKAAVPGMKLTLVEPAHKKASFLRAAFRLMGLSDVSVVESRVEAILPPPSAPLPVDAREPADEATKRLIDRRDKLRRLPGHASDQYSVTSALSSSLIGNFDIVFSRAFKGLAELLPLAYPLLKAGGSVAVSLGPGTEIRVPVGWEVLRAEDITLPFSDYKRTLMLIGRGETPA